MKKIVSLMILVCGLIQSVYAQKEVFFYDTQPENMSVESMLGLELSLEPYVMSQSDLFSASAYLGGFYEMACAPTMSVLWKFGCHNVLAKGILFNEVDPEIGIVANPTYQYLYHAQLLLGAEPRWYFSFRSRYPLGKAHLNAGFYAGMPISVEYALYRSQKNTMELHLLPTIGYRQSLGLHSLLEMSAGAGGFCYLNSSTAWKPRFDYRIQISYAYTF